MDADAIIAEDAAAASIVGYYGIIDKAQDNAASSIVDAEVICNIIEIGPRIHTYAETEILVARVIDHIIV